MANWHVRAVLANRDVYSDAIDRDIMLAIATHIGNDNSPAHLKISTIAQLAGCHYNTADKRTKQLAADDKLTIQRDGRHLAYSLPFDAPPGPGDGVPGQSRPKTNGPSLGDVLDALSALKEQVKALHKDVISHSHDDHTTITPPPEEGVDDVHMTFTSRSHDDHMTITSDQGDDVKQVEKKRRREEVYIDPPNAPQMAGGVRYERDKDLDFHPMISAISEVVKETFWPDTQDAFFNAAEAFRRQGIEPVTVREFPEWWVANTYYDDDGAPTIKTLMGEMKNYLAGVTRTRASPNGQRKRVSPDVEEQPARKGGVF